MAPIYRADQVGSLLRPAELLEARRNPDISHDELPGIEDRHILDVLDRQKRAGFKIFTDGELRRTGFMGDFYESVEGLDREYDLDRTWKGAPAGVGVAKGIGAPGGAVVARLRQTKRLTKHEVDLLKRHAPGDIKMTLQTANQFPAIAYKKSDGVTLAMHLCRGNNRSQWYAEGGYDPIAEKLFTQLNVDRFLLEYESERAGTFEALRFVPASKSVVLGLVSSKVPELEKPDD